MRFTSSVVAAALLTSSAFAKTIPIEVGSGGLTYSPNSTTAEKGDVLEFSFFPRAHNVVQGSFNSPCNVGGIKEPIFSGNIAVPSGKSVRLPCQISYCTISCYEEELLTNCIGYDLFSNGQRYHANVALLFHTYALSTWNGNGRQPTYVR